MVQYNVCMEHFHTAKPPKHDPLGMTNPEDLLAIMP